MPVVNLIGAKQEKVNRLKRPRVGMKADEVLKMKMRSQENADWPRVTKRDGHGRIEEVEWTYPDCVVVLRHDGALFRVAEVRDNDE